MVTTTQIFADSGDFDNWLATLAVSSEQQLAVLRSAYQEAQSITAGDKLIGLQAAALLAELGMDADTLTAALLYDAVVQSTPERLSQLQHYYGKTIINLIDSALQLHRVGDLHRQDQKDEQLERLRQMLLAMAEDIRVVLLMLALRLCLLRNTPKQAEAALRSRQARETLDIFAPLANRLGIGQLKWELEDLALRDLDPQAYKNIARALDERRLDRETYISDVIKRLQGALRELGIQAEVTGRAKHIYSIWRKMQRKQLQFEQLFDIRAVRVIVDGINDCYAALGVVHSLWNNISQEFDDYIANPKENGYQSLHTAVIGPQGRTLEVQIRSRTMHRHAELGVAAHWRYKEGGRHGSGQDNTLEQQIQWFRQMLEWRDDAADSTELLAQLKGETSQDRVYVITPKGAIIDLAYGATPLDFAYHIHTEIGHRCRGARVNGRIVPLNYQLQSGEQVEVLTVKIGQPSRNWLRPHLGYLRTNRARSKVRHWFRQQDREKNIAAGRQALELELRRLGLNLKQLELEQLPKQFNIRSLDELYIALGNGDLTSTTVAAALQDLILPAPTAEHLPISRRQRSGSTAEQITISGVGNLLSQLAKCCQPVPFEPIIGFITQGRGVSVHRQDCRNVLRLRSQQPQRFIEVNWGDDAEQTNQAYSVDVQIDAYDRAGLLRDITTVLANEKVNVLAANTHSDRQHSTARMELTLEVVSLQQLSKLLDKIAQLVNVIAVQRKQ